jgi:hypothetical protein
MVQVKFYANVKKHPTHQMRERERGARKSPASEFIVNILNFGNPDGIEEGLRVFRLKYPSKDVHDIQRELRILLRPVRAGKTKTAVAFGEIVQTLNKWSMEGRLKPQWQPEPVTKQTRFELGQGVYEIGGRKKITFRPWRMIAGGGIRNSALYSLAYLLESGQVTRIRTCRECARYFFARDLRQDFDSSRCQRAYDKKVAVKRMERLRRRDETSLRKYALELLDRASRERAQDSKIRESVKQKFPEAKGKVFGAFTEMVDDVISGTPKEKVWSRSSAKKRGIFRNLQLAGIEVLSAISVPIQSQREKRQRRQ